MTDVFKKLSNDPLLHLATWAKQEGLYPYFAALSETDGTEVVVQGRRMIMIGGNNYLGLTTHPRVRRAAIEAIERYGTSCSGSRFLNGTLELHEELERRLARFLHKEAAITFGTGYQSNLGAISAILGKNDVAIMDRDIHACVLDAVAVAGCAKRRFKHNDVSDLERALRRVDRDSASASKLVVVDGVYSMRGDMAPLAEIVDVCKRHRARLFVDDAHGIGVMGPGGRGTHLHFGCNDDVDIIMGTFSKSLSSLGGVVAGSREVISFIQHHARAFIYSAALPPANAATVLACLDVIEEDPSWVARVHARAARVRRELKQMGYDVSADPTSIVSIHTGDVVATVQMWKALGEAGVYVNAVVPPAVPANLGLLRTSYMATHTDQQIDTVLEVFGHLMKNRAAMAASVASAQESLGRAAAAGTTLPSFVDYEN